MSSRDRRAAGRRRAWGRGPVILRFEPLEGRQLMTADVPGGDSVASDDVAEVLTTLDTLAADAAAETTSTLAATTAATTGGLPDLVASRFSAQSNLDWDQTFTGVAHITNQGTAPTTTASKVNVYASPQLELVQGAVYIGSFDLPAGMKPGQTNVLEKQFSTPKIAPPGFAQLPSYYLVLAVDPENTVAESVETNNIDQRLQGFDTAVVTVTPRIPSNLVPAGLAVTPGVADWGGTLHVTATVYNDSQGAAPPTNARIVLAPYGQNPLGPLGYTIGSVPMPAVGGYQNASASQNIPLPKNPPSALANYTNFTVFMVSDSDEVADPVIRPLAVKGQGIDWTTLQINSTAAPAPAANDLKVVALENPSSVAWGDSFQVKATVGNGGSKDVGPLKVRFYLVQGDGAAAATLALGDATVSSLQANGTQQVVQTVKLPARVPDGLYPNLAQARIFVRIDPDHTIDETNLDNNSLGSTPITLRVVGTDGQSTPVVTTPTTPPANNGQQGGNPSGGQNQNPNGSGGTPGGQQTGNPNGPSSARQRRQALMAQRLEQARLLKLRVFPGSKPRPRPQGQGVRHPGGTA